MKFLEFAAEPNAASYPETILWLHGGNVAGWMWGEQLPAFTDYRSIVPDFPGFGASNDEPWVSIAATADDLSAWLKNEADGPVHLVGLSLGSSVALELAARHPHLVRSLFLASTQAVPPRQRDALIARMMLLGWDQRGFWVSLAKSYGLTADDAELFIETGLGIKRETAQAILREVLHGVPQTTLARIEAPAIAIAGEKDSRAVWHESLIALEPHASVAIAPGMHHQWNIESPELFNQSLRAWLASGEAASSLRARI